MIFFAHFGCEWAQSRRFTTNCYLTHRFLAQVFTLGLLLVQIAFVTAKAVVDQQTAESQVSSQLVAQQRIGSYDYPEPLIDDHHDPHDHHHHHDEHDPGFWKKKVIWKEGWKKYWVRDDRSFNENLVLTLWYTRQKPGKKQIWKPDVKKIWKPVWVPTQIPVWKDIQVGFKFNLKSFDTLHWFVYHFKGSSLEEDLEAKMDWDQSTSMEGNSGNRRLINLQILITSKF